MAEQTEQLNRPVTDKVITKSEAYNNNISDWNMISTLIMGERAIKEAGTEYLPMLGGQDSQQYLDYKNRGSFYNAFARTIQGMVGAITRKPTKVEVPDGLKEVIPKFTMDGTPLDNVVKDITQRVLSLGYCGIFADLITGGSKGNIGIPYASVYDAQSIYNYRYRIIDGEKKLTFIVLREITEEPDAKDFYQTNKTEQLRVLSLEEDKMIVRLFRKVKKTENKKEGWFQVPVVGDIMEHIPVVNGKHLNYIPFVFFGGENNDPTPGKPPLLDLGYLNIKHWQVNVDYYHGLHYCALPTPWAAGFPEDKVLTIGATKAWISRESEASCGFLEFTGQGLDPIKDALDKIENQMAVIGARLLEEPKKGIEAAKTMEMRVAGDTSSLSSVAGNIERGFEQVLRYMARWIRADEKKIEVTVNKDFIATKMSPQELTALLGVLQSGKISMDTFLWNLKQGELLPETITIDDEKAKIEAEGMTEFENEEEEK
ncbi:MAG: DUF4055 domain-containing protein [Bacteroidetes bacterium]|nr:DUF4055 domain-containing protein [Bacteroidota bacterium]